MRGCAVPDTHIYGRAEIATAGRPEISDVLVRDAAQALVYSDYQKRHLTEIAKHLPEFADGMAARVSLGRRIFGRSGCIALDHAIVGEPRSDQGDSHASREVL